MGAVHAEIEHLLKERNIRNSGRILFSQTLQCYCVGSSICLSGGGGGVCAYEITWISYVTFIQ